MCTSRQMFRDCTLINFVLATNPKECDILASAESFRDQVSKNNIGKESHYHVEQAKNSLRALAFNLISFENNQV